MIVRKRNAKVWSVIIPHNIACIRSTLLVLLLVLIGCFIADTTYAQPKFTKTSDLIWDYIERHKDEVPPKSTQERLKKYEPLIRYFSKLSFSRQGVSVNANFLRALISAESAADPYAVSDKNAYGLSQITIETGRVAAKELYDTGYDFKFVDESRLRNLQVSDLFEPSINILICAYLMDKYNKDYGSNLMLTISAWNAGPGSIKQYKGYPPYEETMTLIARVNSYYKYYRKFYL